MDIFIKFIFTLNIFSLIISFLFIYHNLEDFMVKMNILIFVACYYYLKIMGNIIRKFQNLYS